MEKIDIKEKLDEMKKLSEAGNTRGAATVADEIPWRKSHNINVMVRIAKAYEAADRLDEAEEILEFAYDRSPVARMVVYELALLNIKKGDTDRAELYYNDFVELAPHDSSRFIIKYKICKARGADNATLISVLEELKEEDFTEEWAYELANLYHKTSQSEKCIDLCDEIILWFGDGPYVERALEIKMCYQPLDEMQEDKYRAIKAKQDGVTEIRPGEEASGEKLDTTIRIPEIQAPIEKFDTINLQAEIRKSIEEIMDAEASDKVTENMENIKSLVEDIPYLQPDKQATGSLPEEIEKEEAINKEIQERFRTLLAEEYDGQVSLVIPERQEGEEQIEGQMTIDEMLDIWEKMRRAASLTLQEAEAKKLEIEKARALREASNIMEKLEDIAPALEAGISSAELIKEDVLHGREAVQAKASQALNSLATGFTIPKVTSEGDAPGIVIPIINAAGEETPADQVTKPLPEIITAREWTPEKFDTQETPKVENTPEPVEEKIEKPVVNEPIVEEPTPSEPVLDEETQQKVADIMSTINNTLQNNIDNLIAEETEEKAFIERATAPIPDLSNMVALPETSKLPPIDISEFMNEEPAPKVNEVSVPEVKKETAPLPVIEEVQVEPEIAGELITEAKLEDAAYTADIDEKTISKLTDAHKERLSYFAFVRNLEPQLCTALSGAMTRLSNRNTMKGGNLLVVGDPGCGKTVLGTAVVKIMQDEIGKPAGKIGKLTGKALNEKDPDKVLNQVAGGTLIIEKAGDIKKETADKYATPLSAPGCDIFVILEGDVESIKKVMSVSPAFGALFTEKVIIPGLADKELFAFAEAYAEENGFSIGDEGSLALYDRIRLIKHPTKNTTVTAIKEIMDEAMAKAEKKGLKGFFNSMSKSRYDENDNIILREKDFEE